MTKVLIVAWIGAFITSAAAAAQETLRDTLRKQQGYIAVQLRSEYPPVTFSELAKNCDLVARVVVADNGRTRFTDDEQSIDSLYAIQILDEFFSNRVLKPGENVVVAKPGGTVLIDGRSIRAQEANFPGYQSGEAYILFLTRDASAGTYRVAYGPQGAFRNDGGEVEQVWGTWNGERNRLSVSAFVQELDRVLPRR